MRRAPRLAAASAALVLLLAPARAEAWGFEAHKFIMDRAIALLPPQIRAFFEAGRPAVVERAVDPDLWRTVGWPGEGERHFVDLDAYGEHPFRDLPRDFDEAVKKHGREAVEKNGTLPWRVEEFYRRLVEAFELKDPYARDNIRLFSAILSHYVADAHVPFHATRNYDGQLTKQWGIHGRFESDLFERYRVRLRVLPKAASAVESPRDFLFDVLTDSFPLVQPILEADRQASRGREVYDDAYYGTFFTKVRPILERRLSESITAVASMITAAWTEAGRPTIPVQVRTPPQKVRRR
ncbi:MAG TPA: hypothetical protein VM364_11060 [Vicinamibacterales bacterium]|nr:hypothetical protein [Vicinamibacterales bacterium]